MSLVPVPSAVDEPSHATVAEWMFATLKPPQDLFLDRAISVQKKVFRLLRLYRLCVSKRALRSKFKD